MKKLVRSVIIREYDFKHKLKPRCKALYDECEFEPMTRDGLEKEHMLHVLKGNTEHFANYTKPKDMLYDVKSWLYSKDYIRNDVVVEYDDTGFLWIQYRKNTPKTKLGWAKLQKEYD